MLRKILAAEEAAGPPWITGRAHVLIPPCSRMAVSCSYSLSTDRKSYIGFIEGRFGQFSKLQSPLAICWPRSIVYRVSITSFSEQTVSFRVAADEWIADEASLPAPRAQEDWSNRGRRIA